MFIIVAMGAEILPIRSIGGVIVVVAVPVMYGQEVEARLIELTTALGADRAMDLQ
jgi:hypothetical protein